MRSAVTMLLKNSILDFCVCNPSSYITSADSQFLCNSPDHKHNTLKPINIICKAA